MTSEEDNKEPGKKRGKTKANDAPHLTPPGVTRRGMAPPGSVGMTGQGASHQEENDTSNMSPEERKQHMRALAKDRFKARLFESFLERGNDEDRAKGTIAKTDFDNSL